MHPQDYGNIMCGVFPEVSITCLPNRIQGNSGANILNLKHILEPIDKR